MQGKNEKRIPVAEALAALRDARRSEIVVTTMGGAREWQRWGAHPRDFLYVPSSMGQASSIGLGLALARPKEKVVVCNGDGSMLMNLGSLVTITAHAPANVVLVVLDNGVYEVTGAQPTLAATALRKTGSPVDFAAIARACGWSSIFAFDDLRAWQAAVREVLEREGPTFVHLRVEAIADAGAPPVPSPPPERARALRDELARMPT